MLALTVLVVGCVFVTSSVVGLAVMMFATGCLIAPTIAALYERVGSLTPTSAHTEIFGWMQSGGMVGSAVAPPWPASWSRRSGSATRGS